MSDQYGGQDGHALLLAARAGISDADGPTFRVALEQRVLALRHADSASNAEVVAVKDAMDLVFPGESIYFAIKS